MNNQEKKEFLSRYQTAVRQVDSLRERIIWWGQRAEGLTRAAGGVQGGSGENGMQACLDRMVDYQNQLADSLREELELLDELEAAVASVEDARLRQVLYLRYIEGKKWEEIALKMNYDYRWVLRLHDRALAELAIEGHIQGEAG